MCRMIVSKMGKCLTIFCACIKETSVKEITGTRSRSVIIAKPGLIYWIAPYLADTFSWLAAKSCHQEAKSQVEAAIQLLGAQMLNLACWMMYSQRPITCFMCLLWCTATLPVSQMKAIAISSYEHQFGSREAMGAIQNSFEFSQMSQGVCLVCKFSSYVWIEKLDYTWSSVQMVQMPLCMGYKEKARRGTCLYAS